MAQKRISMRKLKEVLRLHFGVKLSKRQIARVCNISHSTVAEYVKRAGSAGIIWPLPEELDDTELEARLFPKMTYKTASRPKPSMEEIHQELKIKGVTLQLLWMEYKDRHPEGYEYSQFCEYYRRWNSSLDLVLRQEYRVGEKMFVDFAGKTIPIVNPQTGEITAAEIFVCVLGASNYTYAEACESQELPFWIKAHINAFEYYGGVCHIIIQDNLKSGVTKACRYEPELNPTYRDMAAHYGTAVIPARVRKPKDKAKVETGVQLVTRWITAVLRKETFFSLQELNMRISELLERLNNRPFRKLNGSRKELFLKIEKGALKPLPVERYEYATFKEVKVSMDYHVELEGHYYSVPYQLVKAYVEAKLTLSTVEILYNGKRVAMHKRSNEKGSATTVSEHRPKSHQKYLEWTPSKIMSCAQKTGPATANLVDIIISTKPHPEQGYRSCLGILRLGKKYTDERLEAASERAIELQSFSYKSVKSILQAGLDKHPIIKQKEVMLPIQHQNIRGSDYYNN